MHAEHLRRRRSRLGWVLLAGVFAAGAARAQAAPTLESLQADLRVQAALLTEQRREISAQQAQIARQEVELQQLLGAQVLATQNGRGFSDAVATARDFEVGAAVEPPATPDAPVGVAPPPEKSAVALVLPQDINVLTPPGHFVIDNSVTYTQASNNRLVFRGVEIVPGIQIGLIEANDTDDNTSVATTLLRYGLFRHAEIEVLAPWVYRTDRVTLLEQANSSLTQNATIRGEGLGDLEATARYQLNNGGPGRPVFVGNLRVKSDSGSGPFDVPFDQSGVATRLNTGSGFWAVEPSVSVLYTSDPVVLFGSFGYIHSFGKNIDKDVGGFPVGQVQPGDTLEAAGGFAFSVNPRFSFSLGYKHDYLFPTSSVIGGGRQVSTSLVVGSFLLGAAYRITPHLSLAVSLQLGATSDAPNDEIVFRLPFVF